MLQRLYRSSWTSSQMVGVVNEVWVWLWLCVVEVLEHCCVCVQRKMSFLQRSCLTTEPTVLSPYCVTIRCVYVCVHVCLYVCVCMYVCAIAVCYSVPMFQRAPPKTFDQQMSNLQGKIQAKEDSLTEIADEVKALKKEFRVTKDSKVAK